MAEQVDVYVKNVFTGYWAGDIRAKRKLPGGSIDIDVAIAPGNEEKILLPEPGVLVVITPPGTLDPEICPFAVTKNEELVEWEALSDQWTVHISDNDAVPEVPLDVNVEVGGPPPAP